MVSVVLDELKWVDGLTVTLQIYFYRRIKFCVLQFVSEKIPKSPKKSKKFQTSEFKVKHSVSKKKSISPKATHKSRIEINNLNYLI